MLPQQQQYCLKWKYHNANIQTTFSQLRDKANYCDVTLWSGGAAMRAHRAVLAACSGLFADLLAAHDTSLGEPAIVLTDSAHAHHLRHLLSFMYTGEVSVHHTELTSLLKTAEDLRIKGLADVSWKDQSLPLECSTIETADSGSAASSPSDSQNADSKSANHKDDDDVKPVTEKTKLGSMSVTTIPAGCVNGGSLLIPANTEPKRRRGRPPLDQKLIVSDEPVGPDPPKRPKILSTAPNILRKSRFQEKSNFTNASANWSASGQNRDDGEISEGEYSEASLDGRDISQFLDTTMEEEASDVKINQSVKPTVTMVNDEMRSSAADSFSDVVKLSDYLLSGRRTQFWAEDYVKRVMEAVFCRELEMKQAAEILGVSYGTLYGRYRDTFGCINRPYRAREFWSENSEILAKLQRKEITFVKAAELLSITPQMLFNYVNSIFEPVINQKEASEIFTDAIVRAKSSVRVSTEDSGKIDGLDDNCESTHNSLSDILRKRIDVRDSELADVEIEPSEIKLPTAVSTEILDITSDSETKENSTKVDDASSSNMPTVKKLPMIRVANLKFLKGEPTSSNETNDKVAPIILKSNAAFIKPDMKILSSKRKVSFQEIEQSLKQANLGMKKNTPGFKSSVA